jgi:hypothetical protein
MKYRLERSYICTQVSEPHALWHAQSAAGLLDYFLTVDYLYKVVRLPTKQEF